MAKRWENSGLTPQQAEAGVQRRVSDELHALHRSFVCWVPKHRTISSTLGPPHPTFPARSDKSELIPGQLEQKSAHVCSEEVE